MNLLIDTYGYSFGLEHSSIVISKNGKSVQKVSLADIQTITVPDKGFSITSNVITACALNDVPIFFISRSLKNTCIAARHDSRKVVLIKQQIAVSEKNSDWCELAKGFIFGKIKNQINLIKYFSKYKKRKSGIDKSQLCNFKTYMQERIKELETLDNSHEKELLRGKLFSIEGRAAAMYWRMAACMLGEIFTGRKHKNAGDCSNAMLNYGYAMLERHVYAAILRSGINPYISFLHSHENERPSLVYDLMEEFRPFLVDRIVFAYLNRRKSPVPMTDGFLPQEVCKKIRDVFGKQLETQVLRHGRHIKLNRIIDEQARAVRSFITCRKKYRSYLFKW